MGYVELIYAVQNNHTLRRGQKPSGALRQGRPGWRDRSGGGAAKTMPDDFRVSITDAPGKEAYPISSFTWLLIPAKIDDAAKKTAIKDFLTWMMTSGQRYCEGLAYAKLPKEVVARSRRHCADPVI